MVCPPPQNEKEDKNPSESNHNHLPPFFEDFGVFRRQMCPVTSGGVDNCVRVYRGASVRMFVGAVYGVQPMHATSVNFTSFFLDEKRLVRSFPATFV